MVRNARPPSTLPLRGGSRNEQALIGRRFRWRLQELWNLLTGVLERLYQDVVAAEGDRAAAGGDPLLGTLNRSELALETRGDVAREELV